VRRAFPVVLVALGVMSLATVGVLPKWSGLVHHVALPPLDLFADVRVLVARAGSWPAFVIGLAMSFGVRVAVLSIMLGGRRRLAVRFYGAALGPALLAAGFEFAALAVLYHWYFWTGLAIALVAFAVLAPLPWPQGARWSTLLAYAVPLSVVGGLADAGGDWAAVLAVIPSAALTIAAMRQMERPVVVGRRVGAGALVMLVVAVAVLVTADRSRSVSPTPRAGSLFIVAGVASRSGTGRVVRLDAQLLGFTCDQVRYFSYRGPGEGARQRQATCPITSGSPYRPADTQRPLAELVEAFREQLVGLPRPVMVVTHSQGAWIAHAALSDGNARGVSVLVMLGPFPANPVVYPQSGRRGPGVVGGAWLREFSGFARDRGWSHFDPDAPLARELLARSGALQSVLARARPSSVRALAVVPVWDLPLMPGGRELPAAVNSCPIVTTHSGLPTHAATYRVINRFLDGESMARCPRWRSWIGRIAAPWGVPPD
jgi:hypothetical protein